MGIFKHGAIRCIEDGSMLENPRFRIGAYSNRTYTFLEILKQYVLLRMLGNIASDICSDAANMLGKASTTDKIINRYCNGFGGLVFDFGNFVYHVADAYGLSFEGENIAKERAIELVEEAIEKAKAEIGKTLYIGYK